MNKTKRVFFIGGIGDEKTFGGELTKNKFLIARLKELGKKVISIDTYQSRKKLWRLWKLPFVLFFYPQSTLILSSSMGNIYNIIRFLFYFRLKKNVIYWGIGGLFPEQIKNNLFNKKYFDYLKVIIVEGEKMKETLYEISIKNVIVMPNFKKIDYIPFKKYESKEYVKFVFLSRIMPEKGVNYILKAAQILNDRGYSNKYLIDFYGGIESSYNNVFINKLSKYQNLNYKGSLDLSVNEGINLLADYDIMLFPTFWAGEGFPGVVIDAYIAGLPIIASDWSLNNEFIIDKVTGIIIKTHSLDLLVESMLSIINDPDNIFFMSRSCQNEATKYDVNNIVSKGLIQKYCI